MQMNEQPGFLRDCGMSLYMARKKARLSQVELAENAHVSPRRVSQFENGDLLSTHVSVLEKIADALGCRLTIQLEAAENDA